MFLFSLQMHFHNMSAPPQWHSIRCSCRLYLSTAQWHSIRTKGCTNRPCWVAISSNWRSEMRVSSQRTSSNKTAVTHFLQTKMGECQHDFCNRVLVNTEKNQKMHSKRNESSHCFCCKMFSPKEYRLNKGGLKDWKNTSHLLKVHEDGLERNTHMATWK